MASIDIDSRLAQSTGHMVFVSYRRTDAPMTVARLYQAIDDHPSVAAAFFDRMSIGNDESWKDAIRQNIELASAVLVAIGPHWTELTRRGNVPNKFDWVRWEVARAEATGKHIVVAHVDGSTPDALAGALLPGSLRLLPAKSSVTFTSHTFQEDVEELVRSFDARRSTPWSDRTAHVAERSRMQAIRALSGGPQLGQRRHAVASSHLGWTPDISDDEAGGLLDVDVAFGHGFDSNDVAEQNRDEWQRTSARDKEYGELASLEADAERRRAEDAVSEAQAAFRPIAYEDPVDMEPSMWQFGASVPNATGEKSVQDVLCVVESQAGRVDIFARRRILASQRAIVHAAHNTVDQPGSSIVAMDCSDRSDGRLYSPILVVGAFRARQSCRDANPRLGRRRCARLGGGCLCVRFNR